MLLVAKIGTSSVTSDSGAIDDSSIESLCMQVSSLVSNGHSVVIVTSGAVAAGLAALGKSRSEMSDLESLQALSAVGQSRLMRVYDQALGKFGLIGGQVLLAPLDFVNRNQYLHARQTLEKLLDLGVIPVINENDAIADDELRFGDNDRLAALVAHLLNADLLLILTDIAGLFTGDPKSSENATLIEEVTEVNSELEKLAGGAGSDRGSGGMASKLAAAKIATWSGVKAVIAAAERPNVLQDAIDGVSGVGTYFPAKSRRLGARKLWIAFALTSSGTIEIDSGASVAIVERSSSLLPAGVTRVTGNFQDGDAVEILGQDKKLVAKGISSLTSSEIKRWMGYRTPDLPDGMSHEVIHRDDMVILAGFD